MQALCTNLEGALIVLYTFTYILSASVAYFSVMVDFSISTSPK